MGRKKKMKVDEEVISELVVDEEIINDLVVDELIVEKPISDSIVEVPVVKVKKYVAIIDINKTYRRGMFVPDSVVEEWSTRLHIEPLVKLVEE